MSSEVEKRERAAMEALTDRLVREFASQRDIAEINRVIGAVYGRYATVPIRDFVPILVERRVREELAPRELETTP
ncbi:three-helix bundle dimerization domain-containing protein [Actinomadura gamaensis]|uniref:Three-helix bundle dimerization domain-containing protein n=1 Tax=Actinomadura gamaensis TaxID=1763541 RepID=A0ABV9U0L2_9ACTN